MATYRQTVNGSLVVGDLVAGDLQCVDFGGQAYVIPAAVLAASFVVVNRGLASAAAMAALRAGTATPVQVQQILARLIDLVV